MRSTIFITALASLMAFASATPAEKRAGTVVVGFIDKYAQSTSQKFTTDNKWIKVENSMEVKEVRVNGNVHCTFEGINHNFIPVNPGENKFAVAEQLIRGQCDSK